MEILSVDIADDALMQQIGEVARRGQLEGRPHAPHFDVASYIAGVRAPDSGERQELFVAVQDGTVLGTGTCWMFLLDNTDKAWMEVVVDPPQRRTGVGSALLERVSEVARENGRTLLMLDAKVPFAEIETHPHRTFAEGHGFHLSNIEIVRTQRLPVADRVLDDWEAQAAEKAAGYEIRTYVNEFPSELAESLCVLLGQLGVDAPTGDVDFEEEAITPARLAERYAMAAEMKRDLFESVALTPDGVVAAQSTLFIPRDNPDGHQWGTFVHREHRGHRLGLAVKVANLRAVQASHPHITSLVTQNAETNAWMIAINQEMGFVPVEAAAEFVRRF